MESVQVGYKLYEERFHLNITNTFFTVGTINHWNDSLGTWWSFIAGSFQDVTGQGARGSHLHSSLSHKRLNQMIFQGLFQPGLFCASETGPISRPQLPSSSLPLLTPVQAPFHTFLLLLRDSASIHPSWYSLPCPLLEGILAVPLSNTCP